MDKWYPVYECPVCGYWSRVNRICVKCGIGMKPTGYEEKRSLIKGGVFLERRKIDE